MAKRKAPIAHIETPTASEPSTETAPERVSEPQVAPQPAQPEKAPAAEAAPETRRKAPRPRTSVVADEPSPTTPHEQPEQLAPESSETADATREPDVPERVDLHWIIAFVGKAIYAHGYEIVGGLAGLGVAVLFFLIGFWKTLFVCLLVFVGVALGQLFDGDPKIINLLRDLFSEARGGN